MEETGPRATVGLATRFLGCGFRCPGGADSGAVAASSATGAARFLVTVRFLLALLVKFSAAWLSDFAMAVAEAMGGTATGGGSPPCNLEALILTNEICRISIL